MSIYCFTGSLHTADSGFSKLVRMAVPADSIAVMPITLSSVMAAAGFTIPLTDSLFVGRRIAG